MHFNSCSGGMIRPQPPTCCCCQRSTGANLSACALSQQCVRTSALHCTRDSRLESEQQLPKGFVLFLGCRLSLQLHVVVFIYPVSHILAVFPWPSLLVNLFVSLFFLFIILSLRLGMPFTTVRMTMLWLLVLWTLAQNTLTIVRGFQSNSIHLRESEASQMELLTTKTRYMKVFTNICVWNTCTD